MKVITDNTLKVFYYRDLDDLKTNEVEFKELGIGLDSWENSPCRICPRGEEMLYILLHNTGNKQEDEKTLKSALKLLNFPEFSKSL